MVAGDKEITLASEEVNRKNIIAGIEHGNETRRLLRDLEREVEGLKNMVLAKDAELAEIRYQLSIIQAALYAGGTG